MMAANMLMKTNIRASIKSMRNSAFALPLTNASALINQIKTEALQFPLQQQPELTGSSSFPLVDFHTSNQIILQSLGFKQVSLVFSIQCLKNHMETRGSSKKKFEEEYEYENDDEDMDELGDDEAGLSDDPDVEALLDSDEDDEFDSKEEN